MKRVLLFILVALITNIGKGQTNVFLDNFDYPSGSLLSANGWTVINGSSTTVNAFTATGTGLTYLNHSSNGIGLGTNMVAGGTSPQRIGKFVTAITSGTAYMSFLINVSAAGNSTTLGSNFAAMMSGAPSSPGASARAFIRMSGTGFNFGVGKSAITPVANINYESTVRTFGTTYLVVLKYTFNSGSATDDLVSMWIDPAIGAVEPSPTYTTAALPVAAQTDVTAVNGLTGPALTQRDAASPTCHIDAVRFGPTWADVIMPPPVVPAAITTNVPSLNFGGIAPGTTAPAQSFNLAGTNLTGAPGVITVTAPANYEVSNDNITWGPTTTKAYSSGTLGNTPVYVRFTAPLSPLGGSPGTLTLSGGGVVGPPSVALAGGGSTYFYSNASGNLNVAANWGSNTDGTGTAPTDFVTEYNTFIIANRANYTLTTDIQVTGIGSKFVVGNGTDPIKLILPETFTIYNTVDTKVDVSNNATVEIANKLFRVNGDISKTPFPYFGVLSNTSTVEYTWAGTGDITDTVRIPAETFGNLKLVNGFKHFSSGFAFANGTLDIIDVASVNGTGNGTASILVRGTITKSNSFFPTGTEAEANRLNLNLGGVGTQTITGGDFYVGQLRTQAVSATVLPFNLDVVLGPNTNIITGTTNDANNAGGGFNFQQPTHNFSLNGNTLTMNNGSAFLSTNQGTISGSSTSNLLINKTRGASAIGTVIFKAGSETLNDFTFNSTGSGTNNLTLNSPLTVNGILSLISGNILIGSNTLTAAGSISGGSLVGHIVTNGTGALKRNNVGTTNVVFPVGPSTAFYHPATINNTGTSDNFSVNVTSTTPPCAEAISSVPVTWNITEEVLGGSNCTISLDYSGAIPGGSYNVTNAKVVDCGGVSPYYNNGSVTGTVATGTSFTSFSPFGVTSNITILPVSFISFSGSRVGNGNKLTWITSNEVNNRGFEVLRSQDGQNFSSIGFVNSVTLGSSVTNNTYLFTDNNLVGKVHYYRLRQIDNNNQAKYSAVLKLRGDAGTSISIDGIAPNPAISSLTANIYSPTKNRINLQVVDLTGKTVVQKQITVQEGTNVVTVDVSSLSSGLYLLKTICNDNDQLPALKFIKR